MEKSRKRVCWEKFSSSHAQESHQVSCQLLEAASILLHENSVNSRRKTGPPPCPTGCHRDAQPHSSTQRPAEPHTGQSICCFSRDLQPQVCPGGLQGHHERASSGNIPCAETKLQRAVKPSVSIMQLLSFPLQFTLPPIIYSSQDAACTSAVSLLEMPLA